MNPVFLYVVGSTLAVVAVVFTVFMVRVLFGLRPLLIRLEGLVVVLEANLPKFGQIVDDLQVQLTEWRSVSESARRLAEGAEGLAANVRVVARPFVNEVSEIARTVRQVRAGAKAALAGLSVWRGHRRPESIEAEVTTEHDNES